jgi:hypothetical protein
MLAITKSAILDRVDPLGVCRKLMMYSTVEALKSPLKI